MNRGGRWLSTSVMILALGLAGCGGDDSPEGGSPAAKPTAVDTAAAEEKAAIDAFKRYWSERVVLSEAGGVQGKDALAGTATGVVREEDLTRLARDAKGKVRQVGAPKFKNYTATVDGDKATVVVCINSDEWGFVVEDKAPIYTSDGWRMLGRVLTRVDGDWMVSGYSNEHTKDECLQS